MNAVFMGLPAREAAALKIFIGVGMKGWTSSVVSSPAPALPATTVCIVDLAGMGLAQWSVKAEADLLVMLGGQNALLLSTANNSSWRDKTHVMSGRSKQQIACLPKPYGQEHMRAALAGFVSDGVQPAPGNKLNIAQTSVWQAGTESSPAPAFLFGDLRAAQTMFPGLRQHLLLCKLMDLLALGTSCELQLSVHQAIALHPAQGWVAHNAGPGVLARLALQGVPVASMRVRESGCRVAALPVRENLDTFLWELAGASIGQQALPAVRDAELKLRSMPGFTRVSAASHFDLQLAAICVRLPQTLSGLCAVFPDRDPAAIARFFLLSAVSGLGRLRLLEPAVGRQHQCRPAPQHVRTPGSFFRSMLNKLF